MWMRVITTQLIRERGSACVTQARLDMSNYRSYGELKKKKRDVHCRRERKSVMRTAPK